MVRVMMKGCSVLVEVVLLLFHTIAYAAIFVSKRMGYDLWLLQLCCLGCFAAAFSTALLLYGV